MILYNNYFNYDYFFFLSFTKNHLFILVRFLIKLCRYKNNYNNNN